MANVGLEEWLHTSASLLALVLTWQRSSQPRQPNPCGVAQGQPVCLGKGGFLTWATAAIHFKAQW